MNPIMPPLPLPAFNPQPAPTPVTFPSFMGGTSPVNAPTVPSSPGSVFFPSFTGGIGPFGSGVPNIASLNTYQQLSQLPPSAFGGTPFTQAMQQTAANSQLAQSGGIGGALAGGLTGGIIGGTVGSAIFPVVGTGIGALLGGIGGAALGAFTPIMQTPQNAVVKSIGDIEQNQAQNIPSDILGQLFAKQAIPNYNDVFNPILNGLGLPNQSLLGDNNIPFLSGLTNPHQLGNIALNILTNPYSYIPVGGEAMAGLKLSEGETGALNPDMLKTLTGSAENSTLSSAGGALRNQIAQDLGHTDYGTLLNEATPEQMGQYFSRFGQTVSANPSQFINTRTFDINPLGIPGMNIPLLSTKTVNSLAQSPTLTGINDYLRNNSLVTGMQTLFGKSPSLLSMGLNPELGADTANQAENARLQSQAKFSYLRDNLLNNIYDLGNTYSRDDLRVVRDAIETGAPIPQGQKYADIAKAYEQINQDKNAIMQQTGMSYNDVVSTYFPKTFERVEQKIPGVTQAGNLPGATAQAQKDFSYGKFIGTNGETIVGKPAEIGKPAEKGLTQIGSAQDILDNLDKYSTQEGDWGKLQQILEENPESLGVFKGPNNELFSQHYLPTAEGIANKIPYENDPLIALAGSSLDVLRKAELTDFVSKLANIKTAKGLPLLEDAQFMRGDEGLGNLGKYSLDQLLEQGLSAKNGEPVMDREAQILGKGRLKGKLVPRELADYINEQFIKQSPRLDNKILKIAKTYPSIARRLMILNPVYHQPHNLLFNQMLGGVSPIKAFGNIMASPNKTKYLESALGQRYIKAGGLLNAMDNLMQRDKGVFEGIKSLQPSTNPLQMVGRGLGGLNKFQQNMVETADMKSRLGMFETLIKKGYSDQDAIRQVENTMFANRGESEFERQLLENVMPFYGWTKNNLRLWAQHPAATARGAGILNAINESTAGHQMQLNPANEQNKIKLPFQFGGKDLYLNPMLPFKDILELNNNPLGFLEGRVNPALSTTAHLMSNTDFFGNPIVNPNLPMSMQNQNVLGMNMNPQLAYALRNVFPMLAQSNTQLPTGLQALSTGLGTPISAINPNEKQLQEYYAQKNMVNALVPALQKAGTITPKQASEFMTSAGTEKYLSTLKADVAKYQDKLYGGHYVNGVMMPSTTPGAKAGGIYSYEKSLRNMARIRETESFDRSYNKREMKYEEKSAASFFKAISQGGSGINIPGIAKPLDRAKKKDTMHLPTAPRIHHLGHKHALKRLKR